MHLKKKPKAVEEEAPKLQPNATSTGPSSDDQKQIRSWYNSYKIDSKEANKTQDNKDKNPEWILSEKSKMSEDI